MPGSPVQPAGVRDRWYPFVTVSGTGYRHVAGTFDLGCPLRRHPPTGATTAAAENPGTGGWRPLLRPAAPGRT